MAGLTREDAQLVVRDLEDRGYVVERVDLETGRVVIRVPPARNT